MWSILCENLRRSHRESVLGGVARWVFPALILVWGRAGPSNATQPNDPAQPSEAAQPKQAAQPSEAAQPKQAAQPNGATQSNATAQVPTPDTSGTPSLPKREPDLPDISASAGQQRVVPDFEGRPPAPPSAREVVIWIPRVILFPAHVVAEYVLRRPVVAPIRWGDEHFVWPRVYDFFTWDQRRSGVYPIFNIDFGVKQTAGLTLFSRELIVPANSLKMSVYMSTQGVFGTSAQDRLKVFRDGSGAVYLGGGFVERPDGIFYGVGPDTRTEDKTFYSFVTHGLSLGLATDLGGLNHAVMEIGYRGTTFGSSHISDTTPSIDALYGGPGQLPLPAGFDGYHLVQPRLVLILDSRDSRIDVVLPGTGVRFQADVAYAFDPLHPGLRFVSWGSQAAGFYDFSGARHVLAIELGAHFVENVGQWDIPFTELPSLGGTEWMRGFLGGRLRGPSTVVGTIQYRYPFWTFVDAELFSSLGNAFAGHLDDFGFGRLFVNIGMGLRTTFARDSSISLTLASASNRLDSSDFRLIDATRFSVGVIHGF